MSETSDFLDTPYKLIYYEKSENIIQSPYYFYFYLDQNKEFQMDSVETTENSFNQHKVSELFLGICQK